MDGSVKAKDIESLSVTLRTCALGWIEDFVAAKGTPVLGSFLGGLHAKGIKNEVDLSLEYETLKAFRSLFNSRPGAADALAQPKCVTGIAHSMISTLLASRKQAADILLFLAHWQKPNGHRLVLKGFDELKNVNNDHGRFDAWFRILEQTLDGRGKMGSLVGASDEVKKMSISSSNHHHFSTLSSTNSSIGTSNESSLNEYAVNNMYVVNAILDPSIVSEFDVRVHLRNQMDASGLQRILIKMRAFKYHELDSQILVFEKGAENDHEDVVETFNRDILTDMSDPVDVFKAILDKTTGTRAYDFFLSSLQHLLLIRQDGDALAHHYQLVDSLVTAVVMDRKGAVEGNDLSSLLGVGVNNVLSRFADQDAVQKTKDELTSTKSRLREAELERDKLDDQLNQTSDGLVGRLQEELERLREDLEISRANQNAGKVDLEEMERSYVDRIVVLEIQIKELYESLKEERGKSRADQVVEMVGNGESGNDRRSLGPKHNQMKSQLEESLERQLQRAKTVEKLEANARKKRELGGSEATSSGGPEERRRTIGQERDRRFREERKKLQEIVFLESFGICPRDLR